jgi:hypothetical protein
MNSVNSEVPALNNADGLPHYDFRKKKICFEEFMKSFTKVHEMKTVLSPLAVSDLADLFAEVESEELRVESVLMGPRTYSDVRKWGRDAINIETEKENLQKGLMAYVWGAYMMVNKCVPEGVVIVTSEEDKKICAKLELGQEEFYNLEGINALKQRAATLHQELNDVYHKMEEMIDRALGIVKNNRTGNEK